KQLVDNGVADWQIGCLFEPQVLAVGIQLQEDVVSIRCEDHVDRAEPQAHVLDEPHTTLVQVVGQRVLAIDGAKAVVPAPVMSGVVRVLGLDLRREYLLADDADAQLETLRYVRLKNDGDEST